MLRNSVPSGAPSRRMPSVLTSLCCEVVVAQALPASTCTNRQSAQRLCVHELHRLM